MNIARQRLLNVLTGTAFAVLGLTCYATATYLALVPTIGEARFVQPDLTVCKRTLSELGLQATEIGQELRVQKQGLDDPERLLADASLAIGICGLPLTRFCMGPGCKPPAVPDGMFFALMTRFPAAT